MKPITPLISWAKQGVYWSVRLRLNALWSVWFAYLLGAMLSTRLETSWTRVVPDLALLACGSLLSALWNDLTDKETDKENGRYRSLPPLPEKTVRTLTWLAAAGITLLAVTDWLRLTVAVIALLLGYLYNGRKWAYTPLASLLLYSLYYRVLPMLFGLLAVGMERYTYWSIWVVAGFAILRFSSGIYKDFPDMPGDAANGKRTFVLVFGKPVAVWSSLYLGVVGAGLVWWNMTLGLGQEDIYIISALVTYLIMRVRITRAQLRQSGPSAKVAGVFQAENVILFACLLALF